MTPCDTPSNQFCVEYYNNPSLSGSPTFKTTEGSINHDWGSGGPGNGVGNDRFSARWRGSFNLAAGTYTFTATADDGIRVYVDGNLIIDQWRDQGPTTYNASRVLSGGNHEIKVEYYENGGGAVARLSWQQSVTVCSNYTATYYNNRNLSDPAMFVQCEGWPIDHNWGNGGPGGGVGNDNFSARWTGRARIDAGTYTFVAGADDGIRVWLDGSLIIDQWRDQGYTEYRATRNVSGGDHDIKVEYYENGGGARMYFRWDRVSSGCGNDTYEPNDNRLFGKEIARDQTITAYICPVGDLDWYRFHVVLGQQIQVNLFNVPADYDLYLFDSNGSQITSSTYGGTSNETINWQANCGGSFGCDVWIEVIGYSGAWSDSRSYNLQWSVR